MALCGKVKYLVNIVVVQNFFEYITLVNVGAVILYEALLVFLKISVEIGVPTRAIVDVVNKIASLTRYLRDEI